MTQRLRTRRTWGGAAIAGLLSFLIATPYAYPEAYIGGQIGSTVAGKKLSGVELTEFSPVGSMSDRALADSAMLGIKAGYYFPRARWFGLETELYQTTPHIKQQSTTISIASGSVLRDFGPVAGGTTTGTLSGDHFLVRTWVPVNAMFRYHKTRLQPYIGFGPALFMARVKTTAAGFEGTQSSARIGLNAKLGAEYFITRHLSASLEGRYNKANFIFDPTSTGGFGFKANYEMIFVSIGLNYHF
jgi:opacity protein-like surface antigen